MFAPAVTSAPSSANGSVLTIFAAVTSKMAICLARGRVTTRYRPAAATARSPGGDDRKTCAVRPSRAGGLIAATSGVSGDKGTGDSSAFGGVGLTSGGGAALTSGALTTDGPVLGSAFGSDLAAALAGASTFGSALATGLTGDLSFGSTFESSLAAALVGDSSFGSSTDAGFGAGWLRGRFDRGRGCGSGGSGVGACVTAGGGSSVGQRKYATVPMTPSTAAAIPAPTRNIRTGFGPSARVVRAVGVWSVTTGRSSSTASTAGALSTTARATNRSWHRRHGMVRPIRSS